MTGKQSVSSTTTTSGTTPLTLGVEEEFILAHPDEVAAVGRGTEVVSDDPEQGRDPAGGAGTLHGEMLTSMAETATGVCGSLGQVRDELTAARARLTEAARAAGLHPLALGTPRVPSPPRSAAPTVHYQEMRHLYGYLVTESETCGCHVHIGSLDREAAVRAAGHLRPWLPTLLALSANSPFYKGVDTGYASWRTVLLRRWPTLEIPPRFSSAAHYDEAVAALQKGGVLPEGANAYWLVRPSDHLPTVEIRVADTTATVDEAVLQAGLTRALVLTALAAGAERDTGPGMPDHMASAALWTAARYGVRGPALHPVTGRRLPQADLVREMVALLRPALRETGDLEEVEHLLARVLRDGTGADRQRLAARNGAGHANVAEDGHRTARTGPVTPTS